MSGTYTQLLLHIVFSTKGRVPLIDASLAPRLHAYVGGIIRAEGGLPLAIGGVEDHVHLLIRWRADATIADLMRVVKSRSSRWVHETFVELQSFAWQEGYGAFSVSRSQEQVVRAYIERQAVHHAASDFRSEFKRLLEAHGVEFDERFALE